MRNTVGTEFYGFLTLLLLFSCSYIPTIVGTWGFLESGTITGKVSHDGDAELWFVVCTTEQFLKMFSGLGADPCQRVTYHEDSCSFAEVFNHTLQVNWTCPLTSEYYMYFFNCKKEQMTIEVDLHLMNPDGEHLDFGEIPLPAMYLVLTMVWAILSGMWGYNWVINRSQKAKLHRIISVFPVGKLVYCIVAYIYWRIRHEQGITPLDSTLAYGFTYIAFNTLFYTILLIIASGFGTLKDNFGTDKYFIGLTAVGLTATLLAGFLLHGLFLLMSFVLYIVIIVMVFRWVARNMRDLEIEIMNNPQEREDPNDRNINPATTARYKETMFKRFKLIMLAYIGVTMTLVLLEILFLVMYEWVSEMLSELLEMLMFICIGYTFRLRSANIYYMLPTEPDVELNPNARQQQNQGE